jgi:hypothetical protein
VNNKQAASQFNTYLGNSADIDSSANSWANSTAIGYNTKITASNQITLGTATEKVYVPGDASFNGNLIIGKDLNVNGNLSVKQYSTNLTVYTVAYNNFTVAEDMSLNGRLYLTGDASMNGRLYVSGDASLNGRAYVGGDVSMNSRLFVSGDASMNKRLFVGGDASLNGNAYVAGKLGIGTQNPGALLDVSGGDAKIYALTLGRGGGSILTNAAFGLLALANNTTGSQNTALGSGALQSNTTGTNNTSIGLNSIALNTTGAQNTAMGTFALANNTTGNYNTANGQGSLQNNTTGSYNTATGLATLLYNTAGNNNTALGINAGTNNKQTSSSQNTYLGGNTDIDSSANSWANSTAIGYNAKITASNQITLGTATEKVYVPGNVGIGTTNPQFTLDVSGKAQFTSDVSMAGNVISGQSTSLVNVTGTGTSYTFCPSGNFIAYAFTSGTSTFTPRANLTIGYLVVGGGGGGSSNNTAGSGGGGVIFSSLSLGQTLTSGTAYTITVGAGGAKGASGANGTNGSASSISGTGLSVTAGGGLAATTATAAAVATNTLTTVTGSPSSTAAAGGAGSTTVLGTSGAAGYAATDSNAALNYTFGTFGGGGGGCSGAVATGTAGGAGGGGAGAYGTGTPYTFASAGVTNSGGGGGSGGTLGLGAAGGSGLVIIYFNTNLSTISTAGLNRISGPLITTGGITPLYTTPGFGPNQIGYNGIIYQQMFNPATATFYNWSSSTVTLTPGIWLINAQLCFKFATTTVGNAYQGFNSTSATTPVAPYQYNSAVTFPTTYDGIFVPWTTVAVITSTVTYYWTGNMNWTGTAPAAATNFTGSLQYLRIA